MKMVLVEWEDASVLDSEPWVDKATAPDPKPRIFFQVGWLVSMDAEAIVLCHAADEDTTSTRERIPTGMVRRILEFNPSSGTPLKIPKRKRKTANG